MPLLLVVRRPRLDVQRDDARGDPDEEREGGRRDEDQRDEPGRYAGGVRRRRRLLLAAAASTPPPRPPPTPAGRSLPFGGSSLRHGRGAMASARPDLMDATVFSSPLLQHVIIADYPMIVS